MTPYGRTPLWYRLVPIRARVTLLGTGCIVAGLGFLVWLLAR